MAQFYGLLAYFMIKTYTPQKAVPLNVVIASATRGACSQMAPCVTSRRGGRHISVSAHQTHLIFGKWQFIYATFQYSNTFIVTLVFIVYIYIWHRLDGVTVRNILDIVTVCYALECVTVSYRLDGVNILYVADWMVWLCYRLGRVFLCVTDLMVLL